MDLDQANQITRERGKVHFRSPKSLELCVCRRKRPAEQSTNGEPLFRVLAELFNDFDGVHLACQARGALSQFAIPARPS